MNKNPFEVRLDVMKMAQEMLDKEYYAKEQKYLQKLDVMKSLQAPDIEKFIESNAPTAYTPEDVVTRASTLYNFVSSSVRNDK
jgi:hypothetical protein